MIFITKTCFFLVFNILLFLVVRESDIPHPRNLVFADVPHLCSRTTANGITETSEHVNLRVFVVQNNVFY